MGHNITDPNQNQPASSRLENRLSAAIPANNPATVQIPAGMEEVIPFFDFYIFAESADPPNSVELAHSEDTIDVFLTADKPPKPTFVDRTTGNKALTTPVVIASGTGANSSLRRILAQIATTDHANLLATKIGHEIGHTFGLRHTVALIGQPPYVSGDATFQRGAMAGAGFAIGSGTPRMPLVMRRNDGGPGRFFVVKTNSSS
jgi:hypothetical protein